MLIIYGVPTHAALAAVLLYQAIALLVPLTGGGIAYAFLRHHLGPMRPTTANDSDRPRAETSELWTDDDPSYFLRKKSLTVSQDRFTTYGCDREPCDSASDRSRSRCPMRSLSAASS